MSHKNQAYILFMDYTWINIYTKLHRRDWNHMHQHVCLWEGEEMKVEMVHKAKFAFICMYLDLYTTVNLDGGEK